MKISRERIEELRLVRDTTHKVFGQAQGATVRALNDALTAIDERDAKLTKAVEGLGIIVTNLGNLNSFYTAEDVIVFARAVLKDLGQ